MRFKSCQLETICKDIFTEINNNKGRAFFVGGCVRDVFMGIDPEDYDIEVFGVESNKLCDIVSKFSEVDLVGKDFGILKLKGFPIDISLPRRESKRGLGHQGFEVFSDPHMDYKSAARRRDFTINSIMYDLLHDETVDNFNGIEDIVNKRLHFVASETFIEDPLRVLRAMQFIARFNLTPSSELIELCRNIDIENLSKERIFGEFKKLVLKGVKISSGLNFLKDSGWIDHFAEINKMVGCIQEPEFHPEGDVFVHTGLCLDHFAKIRSGVESDDTILGLAVLCHDIGKPDTVSVEADGKIHTYGHEEVGEKISLQFLSSLTDDKDILETVPRIVAHHQKPHELFKCGAKSPAFRRLAIKVKRLDLLVKMAECDTFGRPPMIPAIEELEWFKEKISSLNIVDTEPKPIIMGRHLIDLGYKPGPQFGHILKKCFDAQIDDEFSTEKDGLIYLRKILSK